MALAAKISGVELSQQVQSRFVGQFFEGRLINAPGETYTPGTTTDSVFLGNEVAAGTGGYQRQVVSYSLGDLANYTDGGVGLAQKATVFAHDGSATGINFTHVALCWSSGNITGLDPLTSSDVPSAAASGTYLSIPFDSTDGSATGVTFDLSIANTGATEADYAVSVNKPGFGCVVGERFTIDEATLVSAGAVTAGAGDLTVSVASISNPSTAGQLVAVAKTTSPVLLTAGNEAAFYWNLKNYGYYESLLAV